MVGDTMILNRRVLRDLKANIFRYLSLFIIIVLGMTIIIGLCAAAETVIKWTNDSSVKNHIEDGQFSVFVPLADNNIAELEDKGITLEKNFYIDFLAEENSTLRVFKNRQKINLIAPDDGEVPVSENEIFIEKNYAKAHKISVGDTITIGKINFTVCGIGSAPDYENVMNNLSDIGNDTEKFSIAFVSDNAYEKLSKSGLSKKTETFLYSFLLNGKMTSDELKDYLLDIEFDENLITDKYLREMIDEANAKKNEINDGIAKLSDGGNELTNGLSKLDDNSDKLNKAASSVFDAMLMSASQQLETTLTEENYAKALDDTYAQLEAVMPEKAALVAETKAQLDKLSEFKKGINSYTDGVAKAKDGSEKLSDGIKELQSKAKNLTDEYFTVNIPNLTSYLDAEDNPRIGAAADDVLINKVCAIFGGVVLLILFSYVISVFVVHNIDRESQVIGALYSLGYVKKELLRHYLILPAIITFLGGAVGTLLGILTTSCQYKGSIIYYSFPTPVNNCPAYLLVYGLVMPPLVSVIVNLLVINKKLSQSPLKMLRHEKKEHRISNVNLGKISFVNRFRIRQMLREIRASLTLCGGMLIALIFMMISVNCYAIVHNLSEQNKADTKFSYMYTLKYPPDTAPENSEACYAETLSKEFYGYDFDVTVMGIDNDSKYYDFDVSKLKKNEIAVSSSVANKFKISNGDKVTLSDKANNMDYTFTVKKIVPYSVGLNVFMDIDKMRSFFEQNDNYYNVLLSDKKLDIDTDRVYSCITYDDITSFADVIGNRMWGLIISIGTAAIVIFIVVMYLMLKMMIDRSAFSISLVKIFGYNDKEINKLYLGGSFWTVLVSALICVPTAKFIMDAFYPYLVSNVACGIDLTIFPVTYVLIFALIFVSYFIINYILTWRLKKISETDILKNRE
jgi:putative ABC transport system permease protein